MIYVLRKFYLRYTWTNNYNYGLYSYNYNSSGYNIFHHKDGYVTFILKLKSGEELLDVIEKATLTVDLNILSSSPCWR